MDTLVREKYCLVGFLETDRLVNDHVMTFNERNPELFGACYHD
jgi:hypothetical protein